MFWLLNTLYDFVNINAPSGIRTHNLSRQAATDLRLRPHGHWDRQSFICGSWKPPITKTRITNSFYGPGQNTIQTVILYHLNVTAWLQCRPFLPKISHLKIEMTSWGLLASINIRSFLISPHFLGFPSVCHWSCCNCHSGIPATEGTTPSRSLCTKTLWQFLCTYTSCITPKNNIIPPHTKTHP